MVGTSVNEIEKSVCERWEMRSTIPCHHEHHVSPRMVFFDIFTIHNKFGFSKIFDYKYTPVGQSQPGKMRD